MKGRGLFTVCAARSDIPSGAIETWQSTITLQLLSRVRIELKARDVIPSAFVCDMRYNSP
jgi:hypothetical protein